MNGMPEVESTQAHQFIRLFFYDQPSLTSSARKRFLHWVSLPRNEAEFRAAIKTHREINRIDVTAIAQLLREAHVLREVHAKAPGKSDENGTNIMPFPAVQQPEDASRRSGLQRAHRGAKWGPMKIAIGLPLLLLAAFIGTTLYPPLNNRMHQKIDVWLHAVDDVTVVCTGIGKRRTELLPDGSIMQVNTNSCVTVNYSSKERRLHLLRGEALFTVMKDPDRPFYVRTIDGEAQAIGTKFNVYRGPTGTTVTVLEGRVAVTGSVVTSSVAMNVDGGQQAEVSSTGEITSSARRPYSRVLDWPHGRAAFNDEPLADVIEETNRYRIKPMRIADARLAKDRFTIIVNLKDPTDLTDLLEKGLGIQVVKEPDGGMTLYPPQQ